MKKLLLSLIVIVVGTMAFGVIIGAGCTKRLAAPTTPITGNAIKSNFFTGPGGICFSDDDTPVPIVINGLSVPCSCLSGTVYFVESGLHTPIPNELTSACVATFFPTVLMGTSTPPSNTPTPAPSQTPPIFTLTISPTTNITSTFTNTITPSIPPTNTSTPTAVPTDTPTIIPTPNPTTCAGCTQSYQSDKEEINQEFAIDEATATVDCNSTCSFLTGQPFIDCVEFCDSSFEIKDLAVSLAKSLVAYTTMIQCLENNGCVQMLLANVNDYKKSRLL